MALYGHVRNKQDLLDLIAERYLAELELPSNDLPWEDWLAHLFGSLHALVRQRPVLAQLLVNQPVKASAARSTLDATLGVLRRNGFQDRLAVEVFIVLASYTLGFTLSQTARLGADRTVGEQVQDLRDRSAEYLHLAAVAEPLVGWPAEPLFEHGQALMIGAYARHDERSPTAPGEGTR